MKRWQNQEEAYQFAMRHPFTMLDMDMGTGKTRVAIDVAMDRFDVYKILVVCPKAVIPVWRENLEKFYPNDKNWSCWDKQTGSVKTKSESLKEWIYTTTTPKKFVIINYDSVWRRELGDLIYKNLDFDMIILDESHRAKAAGSKVSKYLALIGKRARYKLCLSGTPMANSPLDVYGQYRFLDPSIFGTNHYLFLQDYAIMGGPDRRFIVGFKNQTELNRRFRSIAYSCKMSEIQDKLKLPEVLPSIMYYVNLPSKDMQTMKALNKDFIAECGSGHIVVNNVLVRLIRLQQITSGFCYTQQSVFDKSEIEELNTSKEKILLDILEDLNISENIVVFCIFKHDLDAIKRTSQKAHRPSFELSGRENSLLAWQQSIGGVLAVQIQAGAEGVDMTASHHAIYYSMPHSLALYNQSKARLYRPNQTQSVSFIHLVAKHTIDESLYKSLQKKKDIIESIKDGTFDFGYIH